MKIARKVGNAGLNDVKTVERLNGHLINIKNGIHEWSGVEQK